MLCWPHLNLWQCLQLFDYKEVGPIFILKFRLGTYCKNWWEDYSMLRVHIRVLTCDPSKSNYVCIWLHNESQSESLYMAACLLHKQCGSSRKSGDCANRYVCGLFWPLLRMCVCTMTQSISLFVSWFSCCEMLALSILLLFFHYPTCKDDYSTYVSNVQMCMCQNIHRFCE